MAKHSKPETPAAPGEATAAFKQIDINGTISKDRRPLKIFGITMAVIAGVILAVYLAGVIVFYNLFFPHTSVAGMDISLKTSQDVHDILEDTVGNYTFTVVGEGLRVSMTSQEAGMVLDSATVTEDMHSRVNPWAWPYEIFQDHDETPALVATLQDTALADRLTAAVAEANADATAPVNATIAFNPETNIFEVVPEQGGTAIDAQAVIEKASEQAAVFSPKITVDESMLLKPTITADDPLIAQALQTANGLIRENFDITVGDAVAAEVRPATVAPWVVVGEDLAVAVNDEALIAWCGELVNKYNTVGTTRVFTRPDGKQVTVSGGDYGWTVDGDGLVQAMRAAVTDGRTEPLALPFSATGSGYKGPGLQDWGNRYIDIDLSEQHARLFGDDGSILWESDFVSGNAGNADTKTGVYTIKSNAGKSILRGKNDDGTEYESEVEYWMPFVGNSIGLHDANWRSSFGGTIYQGNGSHGCVNLPVDKARELHELISVGDVVVSHA